jgi:hypothetical protein
MHKNGAGLGEFYGNLFDFNIKSGGVGEMQKTEPRPCLSS